MKARARARAQHAVAEFGEKRSGAYAEARRREETGAAADGNCRMKAIQNDASPGSPTPESPGRDADSMKSIPRRSSLIKQGSRSGREGKKTVSFSSSLMERKISSAADCIHAMVEGIELRKVRPSSRVYQRHYMLDAGLQALRWEPSKKEPGKARVSLTSMREVRTGRNTDTFRTSGVYEQISEDCAFSIVYGDTYESLDLVAPCAEVANIWVTGLRYLMQYGRRALDMMAASQDSLRLNWLEQMFSSAASEEVAVPPGSSPSSSSSSSSFSSSSEEEPAVGMATAVGLIQRVNPGISRAKVERLLQELRRQGGGASGDGGAGRVARQHFLEAFHELCTRPEVYFLMVQFSSNKEFLDTKDLMVFLEAEQGVLQVSEETCLKLVQSHEPSEEGRQHGWLSLDGFTRYLLSPACQLFDAGQRGRVCQDMQQPLSHYFINASHNTCLTRDQLRGPCHLSGYARALRMGCRCIDLDLQDGPGGEPVVCPAHRRPPVAGDGGDGALNLRETLEAVGRLAFTASEYPLIVCVGGRCSPPQWAAAQRHLLDVLGERLYYGGGGDGGEEGEGGEHLPSPWALRGRILLHGKPLGLGMEEGQGEDDDDYDDDDDGQMERPRPGTGGGGGGSPEASGRGGVADGAGPVLDLDVLCRAPARFMDFQSWARRSQSRRRRGGLGGRGPWELCWMPEALAARLAAERPGAFVDHNKRFLTRVQPGVARGDSSNPNPLELWQCGCQLVAVNFQTAGLAMDLHTAWFRQNSGCGYVLRPAIMRQEVSFFSADTTDTVPGVSPQLLHVKVISGQNLPRPKGSGVKGDVVDPYVYVEIHGIPADCAERRTRTVPHNGDNPVFDESFEFQINLPELALVRFVVLDDDFIDDEFIGQYTLPLECVQPGYRHVPLQCLTGEELPHAGLFVHVALSNRRGGGKARRRGTSVRKARRGRDYAALRDVGVRAVDDVFKMAAAPLREATDLREDMQGALVAFRELCGVPAVANLRQCVVALGARVSGPDDAPLLLFDLRDPYPALEPQGVLPDVLRRVVSTYQTMVETSKAVAELADGLSNRILQIQTAAMDYHEGLQSLAMKEGLKGRKVSRALESFSWNITILKGQADLLQHAQTEVHLNMQQIHNAALTSSLTKQAPPGTPGRVRATREAPPESPSPGGSWKGRRQQPYK